MSNTTLHLIPSTKFKSWSIEIYFAQKINSGIETERHMIPQVLLEGSKNFPSKKLLIDALSDYYDANLIAFSKKIGELNVICFSISGLKEKYLPIDCTEDIIKLFYDVIYNPLLEDGVFTNKAIKKQKEEFILSLELRNENKINLAYLNLLKKIYSKENICADPLKNIFRIKKIKNETLYQEYKRMLNENRIDIIVEGGNDRLITLIDKYFKTEDRPKLSNTCKRYNVTPLRRPIKRYADVGQNNMVLCLENLPLSTDKDSLIGLVYTAMLGGFPNSLLFQEIREKNSLAYNISIKYDSYHGIAFIYTGITLEKAQLAIALIKEQLDFLINGDISELLEMAKVFIINSIIEGSDIFKYQSARTYILTLLNKSETDEERIEKIKAVTLDEIRALAQKVLIVGSSIITKRGEKI